MKKLLNDKLNSKDTRKVLIDIVEFYVSPSFGSVKQREFDIYLFGKLQELGLFEKKMIYMKLSQSLRLQEVKQEI